MRRLNFTLDDETIALLEGLSREYGGNKSATVRAALETLAAHRRQAGWVLVGYTPVRVAGEAECHSCHTPHPAGDILFRPVFERGHGPTAWPHLPAEEWLDCAACVEREA